MRPTATALTLIVSFLGAQLISAAPLYNDGNVSPTSIAAHRGPVASNLETRASQLIDNPALRTVGLAHVPPGSTGPGTQTQKDDHDADGHHSKRALDDQTAGGNAYTGTTGDVSSGDIYNIAGPDSTITNSGGGNVGEAGQTISGTARGGQGRGRGAGGNAYTGKSGNANGGSIYNDAGTVNDTTDSGNAGMGGFSETGDAFGGTN